PRDSRRGLRQEQAAAAYDAVYASSSFQRAELIITREKLLRNYGVDPADESARLLTAFQLIDLNNMGDKIVLDYGCGTAKASVVFAQAGAKVFGFDISPAAIQIGRLRVEVNDVRDRVHLSVMSADRLGIRDECVDYIFGYEVLYYLNSEG